MASPADIFRIIAANGIPAILARGATTAPCTIHRGGGAPEEVMADRHNDEITVRLSPVDPGLTGFPLPPVAGDKLTIGARIYKIHGVESRDYQNTAALYVLTVRGD